MTSGIKIAGTGLEIQLAQLDRVKTAIRKLPVLPDRECLIDTHAKQICLIALIFDWPPHWQHNTKKQAMAELEKLAKLGHALYEHIFTMRVTALEAFMDATPAGRQYTLLPQLESHIEDVCDVARHAIDHLQRSDGPRIPRKIRARVVAEEAAKTYLALTGRAPTRRSSAIEVNPRIRGQHDGGPFIAFLADVFEALGVRAKAAGQAKLLGKGNKSRPTAHLFMSLGAFLAR